MFVCTDIASDVKRSGTTGFGGLCVCVCACVCVFDTCKVIDISLKLHDSCEWNPGLFGFVVCFDAEYRFAFDVTDKLTD